MRFKKGICCCCTNFLWMPWIKLFRRPYQTFRTTVDIWAKENSLRHTLEILQGASSMLLLVIYFATTYLREHLIVILVLEYFGTFVYAVLYLLNPPFRFYFRMEFYKEWRELKLRYKIVTRKLTCKSSSRKDSFFGNLHGLFVSTWKLLMIVSMTLARNPLTVMDWITLPTTIILMTADFFSGRRLYRSVLLEWGGIPLMLVEFLRVLRGIGTLRVTLTRRSRSIQQQAFVFLMSLIGLMLLFAFGIDVVENLYYQDEYQPAYLRSEILAAYPSWDSMSAEARTETGMRPFVGIQIPIWVCLSVHTLGSEIGEVVYNYLSKLFLVIFHVASIFVIAQQSAVMYQVLMKGSVLFMKQTLSDHMILEASEATPEEIRDFIIEFYNPAHGSDARQANMLLVIDDESKREAMAHVISNRYFAERVTIVIGDIRSYKFFDYVSADKAESIFIFVNPNAKNQKMQDTLALMKAMAITSFSQVKVFSMVIDPKHVPLFKQANVHSTICINDLKLKIMTKSIVVPGFVNIVSNLIHNSEIRKTGNPEGGYWGDSYLEGVKNELYVVDGFSPDYYGEPFYSIAAEAYTKNILLIGVVHNGKILLNPSQEDFEISVQDRPIVIASDLKQANYLKRSKQPRKSVELEDSIVVQTFGRESMSPNALKNIDKSLIGKKKSEFEMELKRLSGQIARRFSLQYGLLSSTIGDSQYKEQKHRRISKEVRSLLEKSKPVSKKDFVYDISKGEELKDHYVLTGDLTDAEFIIFSIRKQLEVTAGRDEDIGAKHIVKKEKNRAIILMSSQKSQLDILYEQCKYFQDVFFYLGDSTDTVDLKNVFVHKSDSILYLSNEKDNSDEDAFNDGKCIRTMLALSTFGKNIRFVCELVHKNSLILLQDFKEYTLNKNMNKFSHVELKIPNYVNKRTEIAYILSSLYASGKVLVTKALFPRLLCQSYFMPQIIEVVEKLCGIMRDENSKLLHLVKPPRRLIGRTYSEVFNRMLEYHRTILIGYYCGLGQYQQPYVYLCPEHTSTKILTPNDRLFVIGKPDEEEEKKLQEHLVTNNAFAYGDTLKKMKSRHSQPDPTPKKQTPLTQRKRAKTEIAKTEIVKENGISGGTSPLTREYQTQKAFKETVVNGFSNESSSPLTSTDRSIASAVSPIKFPLSDSESDSSISLTPQSSTHKTFDPDFKHKKDKLKPIKKPRHRSRKRKGTINNHKKVEMLKEELMSKQEPKSPISDTFSDIKNDEKRKTLDPGVIPFNRITSDMNLQYHRASFGSSKASSNESDDSASEATEDSD